MPFWYTCQFFQKYTPLLQIIFIWCNEYNEFLRDLRSGHNGRKLARVLNFFTELNNNSRPESEIARLFENLGNCVL